MNNALKNRKVLSYTTGRAGLMTLRGRPNLEHTSLAQKLIAAHYLMWVGQTPKSGPDGLSLIICPGPFLNVRGRVNVQKIGTLQA